MKKISLFNDYGAYPIWVYDDNGMLIINDLPVELINNSKAILLRDYLTEKYKKLFVNNSYEFSFVGFKDEKEKCDFVNKANDFYKLVNDEVGNKYFVENNLLEFMK